MVCSAGPGRQGPARLGLLGVALWLPLAGCALRTPEASWRVFPLPRTVPHDGLAVVNQPDGYGLHIWLETDTSQEGLCRPRWLPDAARLFNGNGSAPFSSGLATRAEFYGAVARRPVRRALQRELEALCRARAPRSRWQWLEPPRSDAELVEEPLPLYEEEDLLTDPAEERRRQEELLESGPPGEDS
jgi:hypothetical protein